jgi:hypothetical protein
MTEDIRSQDIEKHEVVVERHEVVVGDHATLPTSDHRNSPGGLTARA